MRQILGFLMMGSMQVCSIVMSSLSVLNFFSAAIACRASVSLYLCSGKEPEEVEEEAAT